MSLMTDRVKIDTAALKKAAEIPAVPGRDWKLTGIRPTHGGGFELAILPNTPAEEALRAVYNTVVMRFVGMLKTWRETAPEAAAYLRAIGAEREHLKAIEAAKAKAASLVNAQGDAEHVAAQVAQARAKADVLEARTPALKEATARAACDLKGALAAYVRDAGNLFHTFVAGQAASIKGEVLNLIGDTLARAKVAADAADTLNNPHWRQAHVDAVLPELKEAEERARAQAAEDAQRHADELKADANFGKPTRPPLAENCAGPHREVTGRRYPSMG